MAPASGSALGSGRVVPWEWAMWARVLALPVARLASRSAVLPVDCQAVPRPRQPRASSRVRARCMALASSPLVPPAKIVRRRGRDLGAHVYDVGAGAGVAGGAACVTVGCAAGGLPGGTTSTPAQGVQPGAGALYGSSVISKHPQPGQPQPQLLPTVLPGCQSGGSNSNSASNSRQATLIVAPRLARGIVRP
jgi:hypothetical protein